MTYKTGMRGAVCLAALIVGNAAHADVTAAQVWDDWKSQLMLYGEDSITIGAEETSSDAVTVRDIEMNFSDDQITVQALMGDLVFNEQSDGTVRVTMEPSYPIAVTGEDGVIINLVISHENMEVIVSGDPGAMNYAITADRYAVELQDIVDSGVTIPSDARIVANDLNVDMTSTSGDPRNITYEASIATLDLLADFQIPDASGEYVLASGKINGMQMQADIAIPEDADFENPDNLFVDGFAVQGGYTLESAEYIFDINAEGDQGAGSLSTGTVSLTGEINSERLAYASQTADVAFALQSSDLPFPVELSMAEYGVSFEMPVAQSDEPSDFGISFDLVDLAFSDTIWDLFDAGNVLPRDPATFQIALSGQARPLFDVLDPAQAEAMDEAEVPYELSSVTLDRLNIKAAGASVTGSGAFIFDNTDTQTFAPLPRPEGEATVQISGLNRLLDNLVAMGLVPEQDIMGPRMMMGMFARSTGDDQMETSVEISPNGQVLVNGNRVR